jgi:uncharacterized protein (TIGR02246 family)
MDQNSVRTAIEEGGRRLGAALTAKDFAAVAALYTVDGQVLPPDGPIVGGGRAGIADFWKAADAGLGLKSASLKTLEVGLAGPDTAWEVGEALLELASGPARVKFVVVWKKDADGQWRLHRDIWNGFPAA